MSKRSSGILLHITSLPSAYGIGDLGPWAYRFVDFLVEAKHSFWQILPLNPTSVMYGNSPYSSYSAFAGNPLLLSPELLVQEGLLTPADLENVPSFPAERVDYNAVSEYKSQMLRRAFERHKPAIENYQPFHQFCHEHATCLDDYTLFIALKNHSEGTTWSDWSSGLRDRDGEEMRKANDKLSDNILMEKFFQYLFFKQWFSLKSYCDHKNIRIIGDMPIYMNDDSCDVWAHPEIFKLDEKKRPTSVAGVPPDYFSATGQLWGNPVYDWEKLRETRFAWWIQRIEHNLKFFHTVRLDHFRGFVGYWEIPAGEQMAISGRWVKAPAEDFFEILRQRFPELPIVAEDLGDITPEVKEVMSRFGFPGMKILLFAFGDDLPTNPYAPHNYVENCLVYTGTHDNNTVRGWFQHETSPQIRNRLSAYLGKRVSEEKIHWEFIRLAMMSVAKIAIVPMQDVLGLGEEARMNQPATVEGNWAWRLVPDQLTPAVAKKLAELAEIYGRTI
jgi:4-alpha-glucanotransferase